MHSLENYHPLRPKAYSAKNMHRSVRFFCVAPQAQEVFLTGDFNDWDPAAHPMTRMPDGAWRLEIPLNHGHHHYRFLVDGKPTLDPHAQGTARDHEGQKVSLIAVS
jgi:1,4-alpha-glucan branching enzyme